MSGKANPRYHFHSSVPHGTNLCKYKLIRVQLERSILSAVTGGPIMTYHSPLCSSMPLRSHLWQAFLYPLSACGGIL